MPELRLAVPMHHVQVSTDRPVGTRRCSRRHATAAREETEGDAGPPKLGRAPVWNDQILDGRHPLLVSRVAESERRDELARLGVQPEADDEDPRNRNADPEATGGVRTANLSSALTARSVCG